MKFLQRLALGLGAVFFFGLALFILVWAGLPQSADFTGQVYANIGYAAPEISAIAPPFHAHTLSGDLLDLIDLRGEAIVINFWATWCEPCQAEMPELQTLYEETGIKILAINMGEGENAIHDWVSYYGLSFDILLDPNQEIYQLYHVRGQPSTYILDQQGIITHIFYGATTAESLRGALNLANENG